jgi:hypothetical protein
VIAADTCIGFHVTCEVIVKGGLAVLVGFVLFIGSVLLLLSAVFGRRMGYLVLACAFFGWMLLFSALWTFGFWSQGPNTPTNLGPRGTEPSWVVESAGTTPEATYPIFDTYPNGAEWSAPEPAQAASVQSVQGAAQAYLAAQANENVGKEAFEPGAFQTTDFTVENIEFGSPDGKVSLAAAQAYYNGGGPVITLYMRHDSGSVPLYSWIFLIGSVIGLAIHVPFLDRAEKKRKAILTGGTAPPWFGPA